MRAGLISDTHGDPEAWEKALDVFGDVDLVIHAGDVLYHGVFNPILETYDPRRLAEMLNEAPFPMIHARGNCDSEVDQLALESHVLSDFAFAAIHDIRMIVTHGHKHSEEELVEMASRGSIDVVHRGHTHVPELKRVEGIVFVNAGSPSLPKQPGGAPSAAVLQDGSLEIYDLDNKEVLERLGIR